MKKLDIKSFLLIMFALIGGIIFLFHCVDDNTIEEVLPINTGTETGTTTGVTTGTGVGTTTGTNTGTITGTGTGAGTATGLTCPTYLSETFDTWLPSGWLINGDGWMHWHKGGGFTPPNAHVECLEPPYGTCTGDIDSQLISKAMNFDACPTISTITLSYRQDSLSCSNSVDISINGGSTWTNVAIQPPDVDVNIDLSIYIGQTSVKIRWDFHGPLGDSCGWTIDDVTVTGN